MKNKLWTYDVNVAASRRDREELMPGDDEEGHKPDHPCSSEHSQG